MKKHILYLLFALFNISCSNSQQIEKERKENNNISVDSIFNNPDSLVFDSLACGLNFKSSNNYYNTKSGIVSLRNKLKLEYNKIKDSVYKASFIDSVSNIFTNYLLNEIIPYWYGTVWDFNGYTSIPNTGTIACGYFISTTLRDMGLNLNRYKLAQQSPEYVAKSIAVDTNKVIYSDENNIVTNIKEFKDGLFFVGLDNHVGYLYIKDNTSYFIHSNYYEGKVMIERTELSNTFKSVKYILVCISKNKSLFTKWLNQEELKIITL